MSDTGSFGKVKDQTRPSMPTQLPNYYQDALKYPCGKYQASAYVRHYALYIITSFGCVSNLLVIAVIIYTKRVRNSVSGIFLLGLTFADTFVLISEQIDNLTRSPVESEKIYLIDRTCGFVSLLKYSSRFAATVIVLSISFNRLIVILRPMKSQAFHRVKYAVIQVCVITVLSLIVSGPYAFCVGSSNQCGCKAIIDEHIYNIGVTLVDVAFCDIIAGILISVFSIVTVYRFRMYGQQLTQRQDSTTSAVRKQGERHTTILLKTVAVTFVVLRLPYTATWTPLKFMSNATVVGSNMQGDMHALNEAVNIFQLFSLLNHAINLYLYCLCSRGFRNDIYRFFLCGSETWRDMHSSMRMRTMSTRDRSKSTTSTSKILL